MTLAVFAVSSHWHDAYFASILELYYLEGLGQRKDAGSHGAMGRYGAGADIKMKTNVSANTPKFGKSLTSKALLDPNVLRRGIHNLC